MPDIAWSRMAEPQPDGYDTGRILWLAMNETSPLRPAPYRRREVDGAATFFEGRVAVRTRADGGLSAPRYAPAPTDHPNLAAAAGILAAWPAMAEQFPALVDTVQVWTDTTMTPEQWEQVPGSSSHSLEPEFGVIMVTVDSAIALAQAMVHEMAHHKLRAMGVSLLSATRMVTNDPNELYVSPIVTTRRRPMTAVLHAQYSFIHVTALDVAVLERTAPHEPLHRQTLFLLARNVPRMEAGYREIAENIRTDAAGEVFLSAFQQWSRSVLQRGQEILDANGLGAPALPD